MHLWFRRLSIFFVSGLFLMLGCAAPKSSLTPEKEADLLFANAENRLQSEDYANAEAMFKAFVAKYPSSDRADNAQLAIGHGYYHRGEYEAAIEAYRMVPEEGDVGDQALLAIGDVYLALNQPGQAEEAYQRLISKYPYLNGVEAQKAQDHLQTIEELAELTEQIRVGEETSRDNAMFSRATIYYLTFGDYARAIQEYKAVYRQFPESELADDAMWMVGECYWARGDETTPSLGMDREQEAFARIQRILDVYPQLSELMGEETEIKPRWPAGRRGDRYELYYAEVRRLLNRYPTLKTRVYSDFLNEDYRAALLAWDQLLTQHSNSDAAAQAIPKVPGHLVDLGKLYYNIGLADFSAVLMRESLRLTPLPEAHIYLAYYYADIRTHIRSTYYLTRSFQHIEEAQKLVPPGSDLASDLKQMKSWMNYRMRLEALEALYYTQLGKRP